MTGQTTPMWNAKVATRALIFAGAYALGAWLGYVLSIQRTAATFWPPAGIFVAFLLLSEPAQWPVLVVAGMLANVGADLVQGRPLLLTVGFSVANALAAVVGAALVRHFVGPRPRLRTLRSVFFFTMFAGVVAPLASATVGVFVIRWVTRAPNLIGTWTTWWSGDSAGVIIVGALVLTGATWVEDLRLASSKARRRQWALLATALAASVVGAVASWLVFTASGGASVWKFSMIPWSLAGGVLLGPAAGSLMVFSSATAGVLGLKAISSPVDIVSGAIALKIFEAQTFFSLTGLVTLALSVLFAENRRHLEHAIATTEQLRESEDKFRYVFGGSVVPKLITSPTGEIEMNDAFCEMLGYTRDELSDNTTWMQLTYPDDVEPGQRRIEALLSGMQSSARLEKRYLHKDGSIVWADLSTSLRRDADGRPLYFIATVLDVTERKRAEAEVQLREAQLENLLTERERHLELLASSLTAVIHVVSRVVETRDPYTAGHQRRVAELAVAISEEMGMSDEQTEETRISALIHDVGKISVPAEILSKPGRLSSIEFELIKGHSQAGYEIIASAEMEGQVAEIVYQHHERCDGSGYPRGLGADELLFESKVLMIADVVEAMVSHRPYRAGLGVDAALGEIEQGAGKRYDTDIVASCLRVFRQHGFAFPDSRAV